MEIQNAAYLLSFQSQSVMVFGDSPESRDEEDFHHQTISPPAPPPTQSVKREYTVEPQSYTPSGKPAVFCAPVRKHTECLPSRRYTLVQRVGGPVLAISRAYISVRDEGRGMKYSAREKARAAADARPDSAPPSVSGEFWRAGRWTWSLCSWPTRLESPRSLF